MSMNVKMIHFNDKDYVAHDLESMSIEDLTKLRNLIGVNLGGSRIQKFQSKPKGVTGCWQALVEFQRRVEDESYIPILCGPDGTARSTKTNVAGGMPKCDLAEVVKRPTRPMFFRVKKIGSPDKAQRPGVWDRYKDNMRIIDAMETPGIHAGKIGWYCKLGLMKLEDPGDEVIDKEIRAWYKKQGREYPGDAIDIARKTRAEAKEKRDKERAEKKADREKAIDERKEIAKKKAVEKAEKKKVSDAKKLEDAKKAKAALASKSDGKKKTGKKKAKAD